MIKLNIVMYHYVRDLENSRYPRIKALDYKKFLDQIEFLVHNYHIVTMEEVIAFYNESYDLPANSLLLTFDDGYQDHFTTVYPILKSYNIQGSFFIPGKTFVEHKVLDVNKIHFILASAPIQILIKDLLELLDYYRGTEHDYPENKELFDKYAVANRFDSKEIIFFKRILQFVLPIKLRKMLVEKLFEKHVNCSETMFSSELYMTRDQIRCMKNSGMYIGCHGYDHFWLNQLDQYELKEDIMKGLDSISDFVNIKNWVISYPYGAYDEHVIEYVRSQGCSLGLGSNEGINFANSDKYKLLRMDTNDFEPISNNYIKYI